MRAAAPVAALNVACFACCEGYAVAAKPFGRCWGKQLRMKYVLIFVGGGIGSSLRHTINVASARAFGTDFPYHTFIINITGSIIMGLVAGYLAFHGGPAQPRTAFFVTLL